jgi:A/G-specific adenine glycosylase
MARAEQIKAVIRRRLLSWFRKNAADYPWRRTRDPYRIWLSEMLLQQTRSETVLAYYERFTEAFPDVHVLAVASEDRVLKLWEGLGYYARARNLHRAARIIADEYRGHFPTSAEALQRLPGVGRYTAGAVASIAYGERVPVVDGNVKRVLTRIFRITECVDRAGTTRDLWTLAGVLVPAETPGAFNQALMELGARVCLPRSPRCKECPVRESCEASSHGDPESFPVRKARKERPHREVVAAAICREGRYLLGKRPPSGMLGGLWEFPGGAVREGETHGEALRRKLSEELGITAKVGPLLGSVDHGFSHFTMTLYLYRCEHLEGHPCAGHYADTRWIPSSRFDRYALPAADRKLLDRLP